MSGLLMVLGVNSTPSGNSEEQGDMIHVVQL